MTAGQVSVAGHLTISECPLGIVLFAHGSGSSRHSPRHRYVAEVLNGAGIPGRCELTVVRGATHLFEEPGTLEQVAVLARDWFIDHLSRVALTANP
jgi:predicted dienelactone hydrolase